MKRKFFAFVLILSIFSLICGAKLSVVESYAETSNVIVLENSDLMLGNDYLDFYSIPSSSFSFSNNGGELTGNELSKAFDRNFSTSFKSKQDNNVDYIDASTGEKKSNFINTIDISFSSKVTLDRLLYASENGMTRGYPTDLNLYYNNGNGYVLINNYKSTETSKFVMFSFGREISMTGFRFEYVKVSTNHKYVATAKEIIFLQPESSLKEKYDNLFMNYSQTILSDEYNTFEKICELENSFKNNINYAKMQEKFDRAKGVAVGKIVFDPKREFSSSKEAENVITQYGNIASYCRNVLQFNSFGTNRQVTGILSSPGQEVTIFVEGESSDPLPKIRFSQHVGFWNSWLGGELQLKIGKNTFTTPNFKNSNYSLDVALGGPIYIVNPYTPDQQSQNVKVYIEGGSLYPVLRENTDENAYRLELEKYSKDVQADPENVVDVTEIVSDHAIATVDATKAYEIFSSASPSQTITNWNNYMDELMEFGGVPQKSDDPLFDERNLHVNFNVRVVQPWPLAAAYAHTEHVGVYKSWQSALILGSGFGWGLSHEIGHMVDNPNRTIGETSNNMYAKYNETALEQLNTRGDFSDTTETLSSDLTYDSTDYFNKNRYNFLIWWYIECWQKGYWGKLENCYRGLNPTLKSFLALDDSLKAKIDSLGPTEKQVFYSSLVTGVDMSYYFDRWGYSLKNIESDPVFKIAKASSTFNELMNIAVSSGLVDNTKQYKLWYQTNMAYHNKNTEPVYSSATEVEIKSVTKVDSGYNIFINHTENENHLGYEILEGNDSGGFKVIGFTYGAAFNDKTVYEEGYTPSYKIVAVDNTFNTSKASQVKQVEESSEIVCRIGETTYTSLRDAIQSANEGDVIELLKSTDTINLKISKNISIKIADEISSKIVISKIQEGNLITVSAGATLTIQGNENAILELNGNNFYQNGSLLNIGGVAIGKYLHLTSSISSGNGGAISMQAGSKGSNFENCKIYNNLAIYGSAFACEYANSNVTFTNVQFTNNKSSYDGVVANNGTVTFSGCNFENNEVRNRTIYNYAGGIVKFGGGSIKNNTAKIGGAFHIDGYTEIKDCEISGNIASSAAAIYYSTTVAVRELKMESVIVKNNSSEDGRDIVQNRGATTLKNCSLETGEISILAGEMKIYSSSSIKSAINVKNGAKLTLFDGLFENIENCKFKLTDVHAGMQVFSANGFNLSEEDLSKIISDDENIIFSLDANIVIANLKEVTITLILGDSTTTMTCNYGDAITLDFDRLETKYPIKFTADDGSEYNFKDVIQIRKSITLTALLADKIKITFDFGGSHETKYYLPNSNVIMPERSYQDKKLVGWKNGSEVYSPRDEILAERDITFRAILEQLFKLVLKDGDEIIYEGYFEYGTEIELAKLFNKDKLDYWTLSGKKVENGKVIIRNDMTLSAVYKSNKISSALIITIIAISVTVLVVAIVIIVTKKKIKRR